MNQKPILQQSDIRRLARDSALNFIGTMFENATNAKESENIEHLHDMRVASRRLRECFRVFGFFYSGGKRNKILARVKQVTRILGIPREMDVHVALLQAYKAKSSLVVRTTHEYLLEIFEFERARHRQKMLKEFDKLNLKTLESDLTRLAQTVSSQPQLPHLLTDTRQVAESEAFMNHATQLLEEKAAVIFAFRSSPSGSDRDEELHRLRINVKKCRYSLEMLHPLDANRFEKSIELAKELQEILGQIHDFAVLIGLLDIHRIHLMETHRTHLAKGCQQVVTDLAEHRKRLVPSVTPVYDSFLSELGQVLKMESRSSGPIPAPPAEIEAPSQDPACDSRNPGVIVSADDVVDLSTSMENEGVKGRVM